MMRAIAILFAILMALSACSEGEFASGVSGSRSKDKDGDDKGREPIDLGDHDDAGLDEEDDDGEPGGGGAGDDGELGEDGGIADGATDGGHDHLIDFGPDDPTLFTDDGELRVKRCSPVYQVPGTANPYLAAMPDGTQIIYSASTDRAPNQSPVLVIPSIEDCMKPGAKLYFDVAGAISHGSSPATNADGKLNGVTGHEKGALFGKSNVLAPLNSLVGVFLGPDDPQTATPPGMLDFSSSASREYGVLQPVIGQISFIGDGKNAAGKYQKVVVPEGATRLYLGIMDGFEWNNNSGSLSGGILWDPT